MLRDDRCEESVSIFSSRRSLSLNNCLYEEGNLLRSLSLSDNESSRRRRSRLLLRRRSLGLRLRRLRSLSLSRSRLRSLSRSRRSPDLDRERRRSPERDRERRRRSRKVKRRRGTHLCCDFDHGPSFTCRESLEYFF